MKKEQKRAKCMMDRSAWKYGTLQHAAWTPKIRDRIKKTV